MKKPTFCLECPRSFIGSITMLYFFGICRIKYQQIALFFFRIEEIHQAKQIPANILIIHNSCYYASSFLI